MKIRRPEVWELAVTAPDLKRAPKTAGALRAHPLPWRASGRWRHPRRRFRAQLICAAWQRRASSGRAKPSAVAPPRPQVDLPELNPEQAAALAALERGAGYNPVLLDGITGSGKTEVYLRYIEQVLDAGRQVLVLVPEIALSPQTLARFEARFGAAAVMHSNLTDTARLQVWLKVRSGRGQDPDRYPLRGAHAVRRSRPDRRRRGARLVIQADGRPALLRSGPGGEAGKRPQHPAHSGQRNPELRVPQQRAQRPLSAPQADRARRWGHPARPTS